MAGIKLEFHLPDEKIRYVLDRTLSGESFNEYVERISRAQGFFIGADVAYRLSDLRVIELQKG